MEQARSAGCTGMAWCTATSSPATCIWATTGAGACSTWAWRCPAAKGTAQRELHAGTPSYINPEQWEGAGADAGSDLFALGVTLYQWLTGRLPYGEIEPYQTGRYRRDPAALSRLRPDVPMWLDHLVRKAVARDPRQRFETAEELLLALERGASRPSNAPGPTPLIHRDPAALWKIALAVSLLFNVVADRLAALPAALSARSIDGRNDMRVCLHEQVNPRGAVAATWPRRRRVMVMRTRARPPFSAQVRVQRICMTRIMPSISSASSGEGTRSPSR